MAGFKWSFNWDTNPLKRGAEEASNAIEDAIEVFEDMAKEADRSTEKAGDSLEENFDKGVREAESSLERLEKQMRNTADVAQRSGRQAGDGLGDGVRQGTRNAEEGLDEFKDEAKSTAREGAASFSGEFDDVADVIQETLANAFVGFGPMGAAAGLIAAAGIGILISSLQSAADEANELTENAAAFALEMGDSTAAERVGVLRDRWREMATAVADVRSVWEVWQPRAITNIERFADASEDSAISIRDLYDAFNETDPGRRLEALRRALDQAQGALEDINEEGAKYQGVGSSMTESDRELAATLMDRREATEATRDALADQIALEQAATAITEGLARAEGLTVQAYEQRQRALEETEASQESYRNAVAQMGDATDVYNSALATNEEAIKAWAEQNEVSVEEATSAWEGAPLTLDELLNELSSRVAAEQAFQANLKALADRGYGALADELRAGGPEANSAVTEMLAAGTDSQVQKFATDQGYLLGKDLSQGAASGVGNNASAVNNSVQNMYNNLPKHNIAIPVQVDTATADRQLANWREQARRRSVVIGMEAV